MGKEVKQIKENVIPFPTITSNTDIRKEWKIGGEESQVVIRQVSSGFGESTNTTVRMAA